VSAAERGASLPPPAEERGGASETGPASMAPEAERGEAQADPRPPVLVGAPSAAAVVAGLAEADLAEAEPVEQEEAVLGDPSLPHWTEAPTGQVPAVLRQAAEGEGAQTEQEAWALLADPGPAWREHPHEWESESFAPALLADEDTRVGALVEPGPGDDAADDEETAALAGGAAEEVPAADPSHGGSALGGSPGSRGVTGAAEAPVEPDEEPEDGVARPDDGALDSLGFAGVASSVASEPNDDAPIEASIAPGRGRARSAPAAHALHGPRDRHGAARTGPKRTAAREPERGGRAGRNLPIAIASGLAFGAVALACYWASPLAGAWFSAAVVAVAAGEYLAAVRRAGHRPVPLVGLAGAPGAVLGGYFGGAGGVLLAGIAASLATLLAYVAGIGRGRVVRGAGATMLGLLWIGLGGGFAGMLLAPQDFRHRHGVAVLVGALVCTVAYDVGALAVGRLFGRRPLVPRVSPAKTWEGLVGGMLFALAAGALVAARISPLDVPRGVALGAVVAAAAPLGDLAESAVKRDLGVKDMGSLVPGHGGVLDRVDALLFVLPAAYWLAELLHVR
jgi:CDP-diglyceride synthetase